VALQIKLQNMTSQKVQKNMGEKQKKTELPKQQTKRTESSSQR
jgi:hypothetical protein